MTPEPLTPPETARAAARAGLPLTPDRHAVVAATADHIRAVVAVLRELDLADTPPATAYRATPPRDAETTDHTEGRNA